MKKLKLFLIVFIMLFTYNTYALRYDNAELTGRKVCTLYELAKANNDDKGTITSVSCFDNYGDAKKKMDETEDNSLIILERANNVTKIIDAKYAILYLDMGDVVTYLYSSSNLKTELTYMNNHSTYGATDAALIEINPSNRAAKIMIGGATGWISNGKYHIIPVNWVKTSSYYKINDNAIIHYYAKDIEEKNYSQSYRTLGPKPSFTIANGDYKSYDGIYFYQDFISMINDYRSNSHENSVNKDNAYYNYYLYLPHRTKSNYSIDDLDSYIRNVLNFKGSIYGKMLVDNYSVIYGSSEYYMYSEKLYGANAISVFSLSRNESANGRSSIAINKNNIFGHNAVDGAAYSSASGYLDVRSSIYSHGYGYINYGYAEISDSRYFGSHFGNKNRGMNVKYASDVYWGEKAANYYYNFDKDNGMRDYNYYQLIMSKTGDINARTYPNTKSKIVYKIKMSNLPFVLLEEVKGDTINGSDIWYKIQSDTSITNDGNIIESNKDTWPQYNWNGYVYVHSSYFTKINNAENKDGKYNYPIEVDKETNNSSINTYATKTAYNPKVGIVKENTTSYYSSTLTDERSTILKNSYVVILEEVKEGNNTNYLIIEDYSTYQKSWISGNNIEIINKDLLKVSIANSKEYISVYDKPNGKIVLNVYNGNFLPIVGKETINNKLYLKVLYQVKGSILYGYVDSTISNISYTLDYIDIAPVITAIDQSIIIGHSFNPLDNVHATDLEDGDITKNIKVISNNVDINKAGNYTVTYEVVDSYGNSVSKKINVHVVALEESNDLFMYDSLLHVSDNKFTVSGFMGIKGMDNVNVTNELIFVNELDKKEYKYPLTKWNDYPYEMSSLDDTKTYNYSGGWFKDTLDLTNLPNGDYTIYVRCVNGKYEAKTLFTNIAYQTMTRRAKGKDKEFLVEVDYSTINSPILFSVRNSLISLDIPKTIDPMYNFFNDIKLDGHKLSIKGTSHNYGVSFASKDNVIRKLVLENQEDFTQYEYDLGFITNGDYPITLAVSDNLDKTKAWYNNTLDLTNLPKGHYTMYIKNTVNDITYYGELIDVAYTDFSKINNSNYTLLRNDNLRLRMEIIKK